MSGTMTITTYMPKPDKAEELLQVLRQHVPTLRQLGLATEYPSTLMRSEDGSFVEIFEWESEESSKKALEHPKVQKLRKDIQSLCDFKSLADVPESQNTIAKFKRVPAKRTNRVVRFEIHADDTERCAKFYERLFRWEVHQWSNQPYWVVNTGDDLATGINGGITKRQDPRVNVYNTIYVDRLDEIISDIPQYGGAIVMPKMAIPGVGWFAYGQDTEGNIFGMMQSDVEAK